VSTLADVKIGAKVRALRARRLLNQEELAKRAGVSPRQVVRIEKDEVDPHYSTIRKLAAALEVEPAELIDE
jgi:transcriptional regulator with XRE-family HTH domain